MLAPATTLQPSTALSGAQTYLKRVVPWIDGAFVNIHWTVTKIDPRTGKPFWYGRAHATPEEAAKTLLWIKGKGDTRDIYLCMSSQERCEEKAGVNGNSYRRAIRGTHAAVALKSLFLDVDVKEGAYATTQDAIFALREFLKTSGLPHPTMSVASGSGGIHFYWVLSRALSREEWLPMAHALVEATRRFGLQCDTQCTIDAARVLRVPGTQNWKGEQPKAVTLGGKWVLPGDYPVEEMRAVLAPYMGAQVINFSQASGIAPRGPAIPGLNDEFTAGIAEAIKRPPVDLDSVANTCGFVREAISTGGRDFSQPLWNLTTLIATFGMGGDGNDGRAQAHRMAAGHPEYSQSSTDELYDRKLREKDERNIGWPSCATIQGSGCTSCATCSMAAMGKSPLNYGHRIRFALPAATAVTSSVTSTPTWAELTAAGRPKVGYPNARIAAAASGLKFEHDLFRGRKCMSGVPIARYSGEISDDGVAVLRQLINDKFGFDPGKEHLFEAVNCLCLENSFNSVCDWLNGLTWDGVPRLDDWLIKYAGAADNPLNRAAGALLLVAMVRRAKMPGCKYDIMIVFEGGQGVGKSTLLKILAGEADNFTDAPLLTSDIKAVAEALKGKWVAEVPELAGLVRREVEDVKALLSRSDDRARPAYGRCVESHPRRCVFVGTTNAREYLQDDTGNRRFLPVPVGTIALDSLRQKREQLFAEAVQRERAYGPLTLPPHLWAAAASEADERRVCDPWIEILRQNVEQAAERPGASGTAPAERNRRVNSTEVQGLLGLAPRDCNPATNRRITSAMRALGYEADRWRPAGGGTRVRGFVLKQDAG